MTSEFRDEKLRESLMHLAAEFVLLNSNRTSLITVTNLALKDYGRSATVLFTVLPATKEHDALDFLKRSRSDFREFVKLKLQVRLIPRFDFEIDLGEKNRQKIDELSRS